MENASFVCILQGARYLFEDDTSFFHCQRPLRLQSFAECTVCEIGHDQIMPGIVLAGIEGWENMVMRECLHGCDFTLKPLNVLGLVFMDNLDCYIRMLMLIKGQIHF